MVERRNQFAVALGKHDHHRLRAAFDACNEASDTSYDRTTLTRWLDGSVPTRGEFIRCLAEGLDDDGLFTSWEAVHGGRSSSASRTVVSRFESLTPDEQERAFAEIRKLYLNRFEAVRSRFSIRIDLYDDRNDPELFEIRITMNWAGLLPAAAKLVFADDYRRFHDAAEHGSVVFRAQLGLDDEALDSLFGPAPGMGAAAATATATATATGMGDSGAERHRQVLAYSQVSGPVGQTTTSHTADWQGDGVFAFDNERTEDAQIRLSLAYPYHRGVQQYPIRFGGYRVEGQARIELVSHSRRVTNLRAMAFMPPGQARDWSYEDFRPDELVVYLGERDTVLGDGDGVVLSWTEIDPD